MPELVLKALTKTYHDVEAVKNLDLIIAAKEFMVIVGPSGCGKTTAPWRITLKYFLKVYR